MSPKHGNARREPGLKPQNARGEKRDKTAASPSIPLQSAKSGFNMGWQTGSAAAICAIFFILYTVTTSKFLPTGDSGELITAAWTLGVAHQPGYPTFTILSHLAGYLPCGTPAFRLNLLSAILDGLAVGTVFLGVLRLLLAARTSITPRLYRLTAFCGALAGAGLLAVYITFWQYSTVAEVFALNNLLAALSLVLMLEWVRRPAGRLFLFVSAFLVGFALTNQHTFVLLFPAFLALLIGGLLRWRKAAMTRLPASKATKDAGWRLKDLAIVLVLILAGLLPYIYLPLAAQNDPPIVFGDPASWDGFWHVLTRSDYGTFSFTADSPQGNHGQQLLFIGRHFLQGFTPAGVILAVLGAVWFCRRQKLEGLALGLAWLFSGPLFALFANPQLDNPITQGVFERFYILPAIPFVFFIAAGLPLTYEAILRQASRLKSAILAPALISAGLIAVAVLVAVLGAARYPSITLGHNPLIEQYGRDLLEPLEPNSLLIITNDYNYGAVVYTQNVLGIRQDIVALHAELLKGTWYVKQQRRQHPAINIPFNRYDEGQLTSLADIITANMGERPVYGAGGFKEDLSGAFDTGYWGLGVRYYPKGAMPDPYALMRPESERFGQLNFPQTVYPPTFWENKIAEVYGQLAFNIAFDRQQEEAQPDAAFVEKMYRQAMLNAPILKTSYKNLGLLLWKNGGSTAEIISLWETYLELAPDDPQNAGIRTIMSNLKQSP